MTITPSITTQTYQSSKLYNTNDTDKSEKTKLSFEVIKNSDIDPTHITYEEYKNLSFDDLRTMYLDSDKTLFAQANRLWKLSNTKGDEILKEVIFNMDVETYKNDPSETTAQAGFALFMLSTHVGMDFDENGNVILPASVYEVDERTRANGLFRSNYTKEQGEQARIYAQNQKFPQKEDPNFTYDFFLELEKRFYEDMSNITKEGMDILKDMEVFENIQKIKNLYEEKILEKEKLLKELTRSTKPGAIEEAINEEKKNYGNYSIKELRQIPYEEAEKNYDAIKERIEQLRQGDMSQADSDEAIALEFQLAKINYSDNEQLNKAIYNTMLNSSDPFEAMVIDSEVQVNLQNYYYGKNSQASFVVSNNNIHANQELTKDQLNSIDLKEFLSDMIRSFSEGYKNAPSNLKDQYETILNGYKDLKTNFIQTVYKDEKPKFIDFVDKYNPDAFVELGVSKEDEKLFRAIVDDGRISEEEARKLSYEQVGKLYDFFQKNTSFLTNSIGEDKTPILLPEINAWHLMEATTFTPDETFNRAYHQTLLDSLKERIDIMTGQLQSNLIQVHLDAEFKADFWTGAISSSVEHPYFLEKENFNINYKEFLAKATNHYDKEASKHQKFDFAKEGYEKRAEWFALLEQNYNKIVQNTNK